MSDEAQMVPVLAGPEQALMDAKDAKYYPSRLSARSERGELAHALSQAQAAFPPILRSRTVTVRPRESAPYTFAYAPLDAILDAVRQPLADHGLAVTQLLVGTELITLLLHTGGGELESRLSVPQSDRIQQLGSAITYLRRYAAQALLGIAAEEDDDGNASDGNEREMKPRATAAEMMPRKREAGSRPVAGTTRKGDAVSHAADAPALRAASPPAPAVAPSSIETKMAVAADLTEFTINGNPYRTKGITETQLRATVDLVKAVDAKHGRNAAATMLFKEFAVMTRSDLTHEQAERYLVRLGEMAE